MPAEIPAIVRNPQFRLGPTHMRLDRTLLIGMLPVIVGSLWRHGPAPAMLYVSAAAGAALGDWIGHFVNRGSVLWRPSHAVGLGVLLVMLLPGQIAPIWAALGGFAAAFLARVLRDCWGTYLMHPSALIGLLLTFGIASAQIGAGGATPARQSGPMEQLARAYAPSPEGGVRLLYDAALFELPAWKSTLIGHEAGGVGETCILAILVSCLWLVFAQNLRWQMPVSALVAAALVAGIWPIRGSDGDWIWFPAAVTLNGFPIGMTLVLYHLTGAGLLLAAVLFAADTLTTPLNVRGHALFGAGLGALTVALRACGLVTGASWWALLVLNVAVPLIDRVTRRRVWGT